MFLYNDVVLPHKPCAAKSRDNSQFIVWDKSIYIFEIMDPGSVNSHAVRFIIFFYLVQFSLYVFNVCLLLYKLVSFGILTT